MSLRVFLRNFVLALTLCDSTKFAYADDHTFAGRVLVIEDEEIDSDHWRKITNDMLEYSANTCGISVLLRVPFSSFPSEEFSSPKEMAEDVNQAFQQALKTNSRVIVTNKANDPAIFAFAIQGYIFANQLEHRFFTNEQVIELSAHLAILNHSLKVIVRDRNFEASKLMAELVTNADAIMTNKKRQRELVLTMIQLKNNSISERVTAGRSYNQLEDEKQALVEEYEKVGLELGQLEQERDTYSTKAENYGELARSLNCDVLEQKYLFDLSDLESIRQFVAERSENPEEIIGNKLIDPLVRFVVENGFATPLYNSEGK